MMPSQPPAPRPSLPLPPPDYHGALDYAELEQWGFAPADVLDFSVNSNPFGPHPSVRAAIANATIDRYPDKECLALRRGLSKHHDVAIENIVVGNGTAELLWQIAFTYLQAGERVGVVTPTFGEYARMSRLMGATVAAIDFHPDALDPKRADFRLVFVCHPNNPTGEIRDLAVLTAWADMAPQTMFVVDEAYIQFVDAESVIGLNRPNIIISRSMTKDYALAGLRLGYVVADPRVIQALSQVRVPWNVSELAQVAGVSALKAHGDYANKWAELRAVSAELKQNLAKLSLPPEPSALHYFLVNVGNGSAFREKLLRSGVIVRKCDSFGLPHMVRIASRTPTENQRLLDAILRST